MSEQDTENKVVSTDTSVEDKKEYTQRNEFDTAEYKKRVEDKLQPLSVEEFLSRGKLSQVVQIGKNMLITLSTVEAGPASIMDKIALEMNDQGEFFQKNLMFLQLAAAITHINNEPLGKVELPVYSKDTEKAYEEALRSRLYSIRAMSYPLISLLSIHHVWFTERVTAFFKDDFAAEFANF